MSWNKTLIILSGFVLIIAALHIAGVYLHLYWRLPLYDKVLHVLGGAWIALMVLTLMQKLEIAITEKRNILFIGLLLVLIVGLLWEIFEVLIGFSLIGDPGFLQDTVTDLLSDILGGGIAIVYGVKQFFIWNQKK